MNRYRLSLDGVVIGEAEGIDQDEAVLSFLRETPGWSAKEPWVDENTELVIHAEEIESP